MAKPDAEIIPKMVITQKNCLFIEYIKFLINRIFYLD